MKSIELIGNKVKSKTKVGDIAVIENSKIGQIKCQITAVYPNFAIVKLPDGRESAINCTADGHFLTYIDDFNTLLKIYHYRRDSDE